MLRCGTLVCAGGLAALLALLVLPCYGGSAYADDGEPELRVQLFHVGGLTGGWMDFTGELAPPTHADDVSNEERPLFGSEGEERISPAGSVDELIEIVYGHVQPASWESTEGAYIRSFGEHVICAKQRPEVLAAVAGFLAGLEARLLRSATIEIRAVPAHLEGLHRRPDLDKSFEGPAVSLTGFLGQRVSAFRGKRYAYVQDYYTYVAQSAKASDPVVAVANLGLGVDARVVFGGADDRITADLDVRLANLPESRKASVGGERSVDAPSFDVVSVRTALELTPGVWTPLSGHAGDEGWMFYARVTVRSPKPAVARPGALRIRRGTGGDRQIRILDVGDLFYAVPHERKGTREVMPSNYTPPEPPEWPEPVGAFVADSLVQLIQTVSPRGVWEDPATLEARNGRLIVRNTPAVISDIEATLATLRREFLWSLVTQVDVVEMPAQFLTQLRKDAGEAFVLSPGQMELLRKEMQGGLVRRTNRLELNGRNAGINSIKAGRHIPYVQDYEIMIAESAEIANPVIGRLFSGLRLDVTPFLASGGKDVMLDLRFRGTHQPGRMRQSTTPVGTVELPDMDVFRVRAGLLVPLGGTVLLGAHGDGEERTVLLLTPRLRSRR